MQTFAEVMEYIEEQISELNSNQIDILSRKIVNDFLQKLPQDWEKTELEIEQPIYLQLIDLLKEPIWDFVTIEQTLQTLDTIFVSISNRPSSSNNFLPMYLLSIVSLLWKIENGKQQANFLKEYILDLLELHMNKANYSANDIPEFDDKKLAQSPRYSTSI